MQKKKTTKKKEEEIKEPEVVEDDVVYVSDKQPQIADNFKALTEVGLGKWHAKRQYGGITVSATIMGCGIAQMYGVSHVNETELKNTLVQIKNDYKVDGAGCILATLGASYYTTDHNKLLNCGFELLKEYHNYRHGDSYTQRLYCLTY